MNDFNELKEYAKDAEIIATDVDDTITIDGLLTSEVVTAIKDIRTIGKKVILVTGRSGGAGATFSRYLPVEMVIAENGGVIIKDQMIKIIDLPQDHKVRLHQCLADIKRSFPVIKEAQDNLFRLTDFSIDNSSIPKGALSPIKKIAKSYDLTVTVSSIQTHILSPSCSKGNTLKSIANGERVVTIGDSGNDESMFNPALFPLSVGVANIKYCLESLQYKPRWIMHKEQGYGFIEFVSILKSINYR